MGGGMTTKIGVGRSANPNAFSAGADAAGAALLQAGIKQCDFVIVYATVGYNQTDLLSGVRSVTANAPLSGCSAEGIITQVGSEGEMTFTLSGPKAGPDAVGVMVILSDEVRFKNCLARGTKENSRKVGEQIGGKINENEHLHPLALWVMTDGWNTNVKDFLDGLDATVKSPIPCFGGMSSDNFILGKNYQYFNDQVVSDSAACILMYGDVKMEFGVTHGCVPIGLEKRITKSRGNTVFTIEHQTAWEFLKQYLDKKWTKYTREIKTFFGFAIKLPDECATDYDQYIIRAPINQNPDDSTDFATEIPEGALVQVMLRDAEKTSLGAKAMAERIKARLGSKRPLAVLHVDCCARGKMFFGDAVKEKGIDVMQNALGKDVPWLGHFA
jgi:hypothetical protein